MSRECLLSRDGLARERDCLRAVECRQSDLLQLLHRGGGRWTVASVVRVMQTGGVCLVF